MSLSQLLLLDCMYEQDIDFEYKLDKKNEFIEKDLNGIMIYIKDALITVYDKISHNKPFLRSFRMHIDYIALKQALSKYSRDVFGQQRLLAVLKKAPSYIDHPDNMEKYGLKVNSFDPYIHRRIGYFYYWCCMLKPFHIEACNDVDVPAEDKYIVSFFNELCTYVLVKMILGSCIILDCKNSSCEHKKRGLPKNACTLKINIDDDPHIFQDFLYAAHFRKLSRSSLELFLSKSCIVISCSEGTCPLNDMDLQKRHLMFTLGSKL